MKNDQPSSPDVELHQELHQDLNQELRNLECQTFIDQYNKIAEPTDKDRIIKILLNAGFKEVTELKNHK